MSRYDGSGNGNDLAYALAVSPGGSDVFVTGITAGTNSSSNFGTVAYDTSTGAQLWGMRYNGPANSSDDARAIAVSPGGARVFVTGDSRGTSSGPDLTTVAYDAATGAQLWVRRYNGPGNDFDIAYAVAVSPGGSKVFVTGYSTGSTSQRDYTTVAYDAAIGRQLWMARYNGSGNARDEADAIQVSPDGTRVFITRYTTASRGTMDYGTVAYDASTGAQLWAMRYNGPSDDYDIPYAVGLSPDGARVFVTGHSTSSITREDYTTVAYDASTGAQLWVSDYSGPGNAYDSALALAVSPGGSTVFVTGYSFGGASSSYDYATIAYDASTGSQRWLRRYTGPAGDGYDAAEAVQVSPGGSTVFVTGGWAGSSGYGDYTTIAYDSSSGNPRWLRRYHGPGTGDDGASSAGGQSRRIEDLRDGRQRRYGWRRLRDRGVLRLRTDRS